MGTIVPKMGITLPPKHTDPLFSGTKRKVLSLFYLNPESDYSFAEVSKLTGTRQGAVQRELRLLTDGGILEQERRGRYSSYRVNTANPIFPDLRNLVIKSFGLSSEIAKAIEPVRKNIQIAALYGSYIRDALTPRSDIDLLIVGPISFSKVSNALTKAESVLHREISPVVYSAEEFSTKSREGNNLIRSLLRENLHFLIGSQDELRRLAE